MANPTFRLSQDTRCLIDRLLALRDQPGKLVTYKELSDELGQDVQTSAWAAVASARRYLLREHQLVFGIVRNQGLQLLSDSEKVQTDASFLSRIRRTARRGAATQFAVVDFTALKRDEQIRHNVAVSAFGAMIHFSKPTAMKKLEERVSETQKALPLAKTLEAFSHN